MKRILAILLFLSLALCSLTACMPESDADISPEGTSEPVESTDPEPGYFLPGRIEVLEYEGGIKRACDISFADRTLILSEGGKPRFGLRLDEEGRPAQELAFSESGDEWVRVEWLYDEAGNPVRETTYQANGSEETRIERTYEGNLLMTETSYRDTYLLISQTTYEYDANGNELLMDKQEMFPERRESTYDANGNCIKQIFYDSDGEKSQRLYRYDEQNRLIWEEESFRPAYWEASGYSYDEAGRIDRTTKHLYGAVVSIGVNTYDEEGKLVEQTWLDSEGDPVYEYYTYSYDENGNLVQELYYSNYGDVYPWTETTYAYDENGNRTENLEWSGFGDEKIVTDGRKASGFFPANITEKEYQTIIWFLESYHYRLP